MPRHSRCLPEAVYKTALLAVFDLIQEEVQEYTVTGESPPDWLGSALRYGKEYFDDGPLGSLFPEYVNDGRCGIFAKAVCRQIPEAKHRVHIGHEYIEWRGRYYDAETPEGVDDPKELPLERRIRGDVDG